MCMWQLQIGPSARCGSSHLELPHTHYYCRSAALRPAAQHTLEPGMFLMDQIAVFRNNVPGKKSGQVTMRVCEISELKDEERESIIQSFRQWLNTTVFVNRNAIKDIMKEIKNNTKYFAKRRMYVAISYDKKGHAIAEGLVEVMDAYGVVYVSCWEIHPHNRSNCFLNPRFVGVGRQLLCYAVYRELNNIQNGLCFYIVADDKLEKEGLESYTLYERSALIEYINRRYDKTTTMLEEMVFWAQDESAQHILTKMKYLGAIASSALRPALLANSMHRTKKAPNYSPCSSTGQAGLRPMATLWIPACLAARPLAFAGMTVIERGNYSHWAYDV